MIKKLDHLEFELPSAIYLEAEKMVDNAMFTKKKSSIKHLQVYEIAYENELTEVEVLMSPTYVKSYSCECKTYIENKFCQHIAATLLLIRNTRASNTSQQKKETKKPKNFTSSEILKQISADELKAFLRYYASKNKKFDMALKVNFARRVKVDDTKEKYELIFDRLLPYLKSDRYTIPTINAYIKHAKEIFEQYKDARSLQQYEEAVIIIILLFRKTAFASAHCFPHDTLETFYKALHDEITALYKENIAPELREKLILQLIEIISLSFYKLLPDYNLVMPIMKFEGKKNKDLLLETLYTKISNSYFDQQIPLIANYIIILSSQLNKSIDALYKLISAEHLPDLFHYLFLNQDYELVENVITEFKKHDKFRQFSFHEVEIAIAKKSGKKDKIVEVLTEKLLKSYDKKAFGELLSINNDLSITFLHKLLNKYKEIIATGNEKLISPVLKIYQHLHEYEMLTEYILENERYDLMTEFIREIARNNSTLLEYYYRKYTEKAELDFSHAHRNQIHLRQNFYAIDDAKISADYLQKLDDFKQELEELEDMMEE